MLVNNPCTNDSRVIREAEALAAAGHEVTVLARLAPGLDVRHTLNGVTYRRVSGLVEPWISSRQRQHAWHAAQRHRRSWCRSPWARWRKKPISLLAYACTWRRNVTTAAPAEVSVAAAPGATPAAPSGFVQRASNYVWRNLRWLCRKARNLIALPYRRARKLLRSPIMRLRRMVIPIVLFEDVDVAMAAPLHELQPDVIHAHDLITLPTASEAAARLGCRLVYDSHELELHRNAPYSAIAQWWRARMERRHIAKAHLVITVSDSIADHLAQQYRIARPLIVLNAPSFDLYEHGPGATLRTHLGIGPDTPLAVYVGRVTFGRGVEFCVQALAHDPALHFAAVGPREAATEQRLKALAEALGVTDRLHLVDPVAPEAVVPFIQDADVSLLPIQNVCLSYYYCMPNKLLESVMSGLPVAVANLVELRKFVEANGCGVVMDETDPADIARAIRTISSSPAAYRLTPDRRQVLKNEYSWERQASRLVQNYPDRMLHASS